MVGNPLDHLPTLPVRPGTVAVMAMLLGSTAFDSFSGFTGFRNFVDRNAAKVPPSVRPAAAPQSGPLACWSSSPLWA